MTAPDSKIVTYVQQLCYTYTANKESPLCNSITWVTRGTLFAILITINSLALGLNLRGMSQMGSTLGTILSTGTNFSMSAFLGYLLFHEQLTLQWWIGASFIIIGTLLISIGTSTGSTDKEISTTTTTTTATSRSSTRINKNEDKKTK